MAVLADDDVVVDGNAERGGDLDGSYAMSVRERRRVGVRASAALHLSMGLALATCSTVTR